MGNKLIWLIAAVIVLLVIVVPVIARKKSTGKHQTVNNQKSVEEDKISPFATNNCQWEVVPFNYEGSPHVGTFNRTLRKAGPQKEYQWFLTLSIAFTKTAGEDMPVNEDIVEMQDFSEFLDKHLAVNSNNPNALFLARITGQGQTDMMWYVRDPDMAHRYLSALIKSEEYPFDFRYEMIKDADWKEACYWWSGFHPDGSLN